MGLFLYKTKILTFGLIMLTCCYSFIIPSSSPQLKNNLITSSPLLKTNISLRLKKNNDEFNTFYELYRYYTKNTDIINYYILFVYIRNFITLLIIMTALKQYNQIH